MSYLLNLNFARLPYFKIFFIYLFILCYFSFYPYVVPIYAKVFSTPTYTLIMFVTVIVIYSVCKENYKKNCNMAFLSLM